MGRRRRMAGKGRFQPLRWDDDRWGSGKRRGACLAMIGRHWGVLDTMQRRVHDDGFRHNRSFIYAGQVRCYGRTLTPSMMKKNEEISAIKKQHKDEVSGMKRQMDGLTLLVRNMLKLQHPNLDEEEISNMMEASLGNENSVAPHSSASTYVPPHEKNGENDDFHEGDGDEDREGEGEGEREGEEGEEGEEED
ncbi:uncharacterized protein LOC130714947 [Lotus japonicus]|uniref:uncharacterized protein LOC130714947 n=1 Tax=Lotus japonicus TaxID=34305 RepID=UPI002583E6C4|nr:uncharacterized protein LOC130714947 [Lotus japonicus]